MDQSETRHPLLLINGSDSDADDSILEESFMTKASGGDQRRRLHPTFLTRGPVIYKKDYMGEVLKQYENHQNYEQAYKEYKDLISASPGPVVSFKEENVTEEQRTYKPNLALILLAGCKACVKNGTIAWREYIDCIEQHKTANSADRSKQIHAVDPSTKPPKEFSPETPAEAENTTKADTQLQTENEKQILTLFELLDKEDNKDSDEFEEAQQDLVHMFTCQAVLRSSFPHANLLQHVTVNIDKPEDVPEDVRERALYRYLTNLKPERFDGHYSEIWREYGTLLMAENLLDLAKKANGPDQNLYVVVRKRQFYEMQSELQLKVLEIEELSTRLSKYEIQQLTERNPNIADLSDTSRPTRLAEMYSELFDDEWSEAFEAFKDSTMAKESEDDDDELYPNILSILQTLLQEAFSFCREKSCEQLQELENKIKEALKQYTEPQTQRPIQRKNKMYTKVHKIDEPFQKPLDQTTKTFSKIIRVAKREETARYQTQIFINEKLPKVLPDDKVRQDQRVIYYVKKCVELCWFMNVQDPPMELVAPKEGDSVDKNLFSYHERKGKVVQTCVWAALLLHKEGPVVCKGYILPKPK